MSAVARYRIFTETARTFIEAYGFTSESAPLNLDLLLSLLAPDFQQSWGHNYMIQDKPELQKPLDRDGLLAHMKTMMPFLKSCRIIIHDIIVDEPARKVMIRSSFFICTKGQDDEEVENDLIWILKMNITGDKIEHAMEFLDAAATARIMERIALAKEEN